MKARIHTDFKSIAACEKVSRKTHHIYLVTDGANPDHAHRAVIFNSPSIHKVLDYIVENSECKKELANWLECQAKNMKVWLIDLSSTKTTNWLQWGKEIKSDYLVAESCLLKEKLQEKFPTMLSAALALGAIHKANLPNVLRYLKPVDSVKKAAVGVTQSAISYCYHLLKFPEVENLTVAFPNKDSALEERWKQTGDMNDGDYKLEKVKLLNSPKQLGAREDFDHVFVHYKGEPTRVLGELININTPTLRATLPSGEVVILQHNALILADEFLKLLRMVDPSITQIDMMEACQSFTRGEVKPDISDTKIVKALELIKFQTLKTNGDWTVTDISQHSIFAKEIGGELLEISTMDKLRRAVKKRFFIETLYVYLQHPLNRSFSSFREKPEHMYFMRWVLKRDITAE